MIARFTDWGHECEFHDSNANWIISCVVLGLVHVPWRCPCRTRWYRKNRDSQGSGQSFRIIVCRYQLWRGHGLQGEWQLTNQWRLCDSEYAWHDTNSWCSCAWLNWHRLSFFYDDCFLNKFLSTGKHSAMSSSEMRLFMALDFYARWVVALTDFHYVFFFCVCLSPVYWQNLLGPSTVWRLGLFWWVQPYWRFCVVCHLYSNQNTAKLTQQPPQETTGNTSVYSFALCVACKVASHADVLRGSSRVPAARTGMHDDPIRLRGKLHVMWIKLFVDVNLGVAFRWNLSRSALVWFISPSTIHHLIKQFSWFCPFCEWLSVGLSHRFQASFRTVSVTKRGGLLLENVAL